MALNNIVHTLASSSLVALQVLRKNEKKHRVAANHRPPFRQPTSSSAAILLTARVAEY